MSDLWSLFLNNQGPIINKWHHYFPAYERHFSRFVNRSVRFLEIGVYKGGSLNMWKQYFGPNALIVGIDIDENCRKFDHPEWGIHVRIGDQSDPAFLQRIVDEFGPFDIVLDDGSHIMKHVIASFDFLYRHVTREGVYMVEDMHTSYWEKYGGGLEKEGSFIEKSKKLIDYLNFSHTEGKIKENDFSLSTGSISFYDSIVVFEKSEFRPLASTKTGVDDADSRRKKKFSLSRLKRRIRQRREGEKD